jgi:hypothetical protein
MKTRPTLDAVEALVPKLRPVRSMRMGGLSALPRSFRSTYLEQVVEIGAEEDIEP